MAITVDNIKQFKEYFEGVMGKHPTPILAV